ncbi:transposase [Streptomyces sp. SD31]|uniref:transposase n=1 Tax=Streptomyces sp. SD31 TaxID=3452208 RepID=UPI003F8B8CB7
MATRIRRRKTGSKHHLICDGRGTPLKVITTAANVNDVTQTLVLVDGIPPVAGRPGRPRRRPEALLGDKGYDSNTHRDESRRRRILPVISRKGSPNIKGMGKLRYVVEQTFALLHHFKTPRRPLGTPHRTARRLRLPRLQPHLLATASEAQERLTGVRAGQGPSGLFQTVGTLRIHGEAREMIVEAEPSSLPSRRFRGTGFCVLVGGLTAVVTIAAIGRAWTACDIGSSAAANGMTLLFLTPLIWIAAAVPWVILHSTLGRRHRRTALTAGLIFTVWFTWFLVTWLGMPDSYPAPLCPDNVPPWWPSFIPA